MSKIGNHVIGMQEYGLFSAWSADGKSQQTLDGPLNPDRLVSGYKLKNMSMMSATNLRGSRGGQGRQYISSQLQT